MLYVYRQHTHLRQAFQLGSVLRSWHKQLDVIVKSTGGQHGQVRMRLQHVDDAAVVGVEVVDDALRVALPQKDVAAVAAADDVLAVRTVVVHAFHCKHTYT